METVLIDLLVSGGSHGLLIAIVIVLWRENRRLAAKIEDVRQIASGAHSLILAQNALIYDQEAKKTGAGRQPHKMPTDEPYTGNPPYRPNKQ